MFGPRTDWVTDTVAPLCEIMLVDAELGMLSINTEIAARPSE